MPNLDRILVDSFRNSEHVVPFELNRQLQDLYPNQHILYTYDSDFDLIDFAEAGNCALWPLEGLSPLIATWWRGQEDKVWFSPEHALSEIVWKGHRLKCLSVDGETYYHFIVADNPYLATEFFQAVCKWNNDSDYRVIVYDGRFRRSEALEKNLQTPCWDTLILEDELKDRIYREVTTFFESKEMFYKYRIPWRKGILLFGPPGNGKTHAIKGLLSATKKPCLVVRSLSHKDDSDESATSRIFARARSMSPAIVVLEDIDSLVKRAHLSSLLNEMDGLAKNDGLLFVATTNHLNALDPALSNRPSRFDRKFEIANPAKRQREIFLATRFEQFESEMRPTENGLKEAVKRTTSFSGAMLQELVTASALLWVHEGGNTAMDEILKIEIEALNPRKESSSADLDEGDDD